MKKYGLIGYPISHSFSPGYFDKKFEKGHIIDARYDLYPLEKIIHFKTLSDISGLNVTIPYKESVIPYLDELSEEARKIGAVNTIKFIDGKTKGYNTDIYGFEQSLTSLWKENPPAKALVLGTGGAAKAVWYVLDKLGIEYMKVSRSKGDITYSNLERQMISSHHLIINTTPLGMSPNISQCPDITYRDISSDHILFDIVYNPEKTLFLTKGEKRGAIIKNGLDMLKLQADKAWDIWNNTCNE